MSYYVNIKKLNGRNDYYELATQLFERGYEDRVEYNCGYGPLGDGMYVDPHLKFNNEQDALAYILTYGGIICTELPTYMSAGG